MPTKPFGSSRTTLFLTSTGNSIMDTFSSNIFVAMLLAFHIFAATTWKVVMFFKVVFSFRAFFLKLAFFFWWQMEHTNLILGRGLRSIGSTFALQSEQVVCFSGFWLLKMWMAYLWRVSSSQKCSTCIWYYDEVSTAC